MHLEDADHPVQSLYSAHPASFVGSWIQRRDEASKQHTGEHVQYARPAITTGAKLPWNSSTNKSSYWPPRAFTNQQSRPAITILSNKQEATKLVYSKEAEKGPVLQTPFEQRSHLRLSDEEDQSESETFKPKQASVGMEAAQPPQPPAPALASFRLERSFANKGSIPANPSSEPALRSSAAIQQVAQISTPVQSLPILPALGSGEGSQNTSLPTRGSSSFWATSHNPLEAAPYRLQQFVPMVPSVSEGATQELASCSSFATVPATSHSLLLQKSSGTSLQMSLTGNLQTQDLEPPLPANSPDDSRQLESSSRSQSPDGRKRKTRSGGSLRASSFPEDADVSGKESGNTALQEPKPCKRRITRASGTKLPEKKTQEALEKMIEKLQKEHMEYQTKWERQLDHCSELKSNLEATKEKLQVQEDLNTKMKAEVQFLRNSLAMCSSFSGNPETNTKHDQRNHCPQQIPEETLWMDDCTMPISMPTHEEIAAEFEMECPLVPTSRQQLQAEWQMW